MAKKSGPSPTYIYRVPMRSPTHLRVHGARTHYAAGSGGEERTVLAITGQGCSIMVTKAFLAVAVDNT